MTFSSTRWHNITATTRNSSWTKTTTSHPPPACAQKPKRKAAHEVFPARAMETDDPEKTLACRLGRLQTFLSLSDLQHKQPLPYDTVSSLLQRLRWAFKEPDARLTAIYLASTCNKTQGSEIKLEHIVCPRKPDATSQSAGLANIIFLIPDDQQSHLWILYRWWAGNTTIEEMSPWQDSHSHLDDRQTNTRKLLLRLICQMIHPRDFDMNKLQIISRPCPQTQCAADWSVYAVFFAQQLYTATLSSSNSDKALSELDVQLSQEPQSTLRLREQWAIELITNSRLPYLLFATPPPAEGPWSTSSGRILLHENTNQMAEFASGMRKLHRRHTDVLRKAVEWELACLEGNLFDIETQGLARKIGEAYGEAVALIVLFRWTTQRKLHRVICDAQAVL